MFLIYFFFIKFFIEFEFKIILFHILSNFIILFVLFETILPQKNFLTKFDVFFIILNLIKIGLFIYDIVCKTHLKLRKCIIKKCKMY